MDVTKVMNWSANLNEDVEVIDSGVKLNQYVDQLVKLIRRLCLISANMLLVF